MKPVRYLFQIKEKLQPKPLKREETALVHYITLMEKYYNAFTKDLSKRKEIFEECTEYWRHIFNNRGCSKELFNMLKTNLEAIGALETFLETKLKK
jgi:ribosomal protein S17E